MDKKKTMHYFNHCIREEAKRKSVKGIMYTLISDVLVSLNKFKLGAEFMRKGEKILCEISEQRTQKS